MQKLEYAGLPPFSFLEALECEPSSKLASFSMDRPVPLKYRFYLALHSAICRNCRIASSQIGFLHSIARSIDSALPLLNGSFRFQAERKQRLKTAFLASIQRLEK